ncbi:MAG: hypothetical protein KC656_25680, partial [Myxococcales bacterium]|nr:hypothetical protein [Myxococcales bacterium]
LPYPIPPSGEAAVVVVDAQVFPGMCYEDFPLDIVDPTTFGVNVLARGALGREPLLLATRIDPAKRADPDNLRPVAVMFACLRWNAAPPHQHHLEGFALEPVDLTDMRRTSEGGLRARYVARPWMEGVNAGMERIAEASRILGYEPPENHLMRLAAYGNLLARVRGGPRAIQALVEGGSTALVAAVLDAAPDLGERRTQGAGPSDALVEAYRAGALASLARQLAFQRFVAGRAWSMDIDDATFALGHGATRDTFPLHILGTVDPAGRSFLHGWANHEMALPKPLVSAGEDLRVHDIPELHAPLVPLDPDVMYMLFVAQSSLDGRPYFYAKAPTGGPGVMLLVDREVAIDNTVLVEAISKLVVTGPPIPDHGEAITRSLDLLGLPYTRVGPAIRVTSSSGEVTVTLHENGMLKTVGGLLRSEPRAEA